jgi:hypothetical protein
MAKFKIQNGPQKCPLRLLTLRRDRNAGLRAGAGGCALASKAGRTSARPGGRGHEARNAGPTRVPRLRGGAWSQSEPQLDLERLYLRSIKVLTAKTKTARRFGFLDEILHGRRMTASQIAAFNKRREAQWGVAPHDRQAVLDAFQARPFVMLKRLEMAELRKFERGGAG